MKLKNATAMGMATMKIMVVPCIVNSWLYKRAETSVCSALNSCMRMMSASDPAMTSQNIDVTKYMMPMRL